MCAAWTVAVVDGPDRGQIWRALDLAERRVLIGRDPACELRLSDAEVALHHAALEYDGGSLHLVDVGSSTGLWLGSVRVRDVYLSGGEELRVGQTTLAFSPSEADAPSPAAAPPGEDASADFLSAVVTSGMTYPLARDKVVEEFTRRYVEHMLREHGGNVTRAAAASGIGRRYFQMVRGKSG